MKSSGYLHVAPVLIACAMLLNLSLALVSPVSAEEEATDQPAVHVDEWLMLGPIDAPMPAFDDEGEEPTSGGDLLAYPHVNLTASTPEGGGSVNLIGGRVVEWSAFSTAGGVALDAAESMARVAYLAAYIDVPRWMKVKFKALGSHPFELFVGGESVIKQKKEADTADDDAEKSGTAKLERGKHLVLVKTVYIPTEKSDKEWTFDARVSPGKGFDETPTLSVSPARTMNIGDVLDVTTAGGLAMSPNGEFVVVTMSKRSPPEGKSERWVEIRRTKDGEIVRALKDIKASGWQWLPKGDRLSYVTKDDKKGTLRVLDLETGGIETVVDKVENFSGYTWSPDETFVVYSVSDEPEENKTGVQRLRGLQDRRHNARSRTFLYLASFPEGMTRRLTSGKVSASIEDIHPERHSILVARSEESLESRPYTRTELVELDLDTQSENVILEGHWLRSARWSPEGDRILVLASPTSFGDVGYDLPEGVIPNDYDTQAYIIDPDTKAVDAITLEFDPTVRAAYWPKSGGSIYVVASEQEYARFYRYELKKRRFTPIDVGYEMIHGHDVSAERPEGVFVGSSANVPWKLCAVDLSRGKVRMLFDTSAERFEHVTVGNVEAWNYTTSGGKEIVGRIHFPPNFDASRSWPCIVYYYGGTSPVGRSFGGRYPKNLWASMGYVVYVLQPSGATGFGQEWSALHVNDWGKIVADEIIEGTEQFLRAHDYVDPERVGCIGASFGGFMTQLLVTKTDMFAAAVSHAGISSITSYWGEGYWGYGYNSVAAANSFPWNRRDIYVDQSPLYSADKINTPLLLLHGTSDKNVPPGESEQMYTALKLLGKEVEYIRVEGQDHWILDYKKRITWSNAIVSWFDRWLKDQPEWWEDMYPPLDKEDDEAQHAEG